MKKLLPAVMLFLLAACGEQVEIPPAHVGKILTKSGYSPETIAPSKFRLEPCWAYCDKLVLLEASDTPFKEAMVVFMPDDKLNLTVDVRGTLTIPTSDAIVDALYNKIPAQGEGTTSTIGAKTVYKTYGKQALRGIVRAELVKYTIADVIGKREQISANIHATIQEKMKATKTPLIVSRFELAKVQPPEVIVLAQQSAKEREIAIQQAEADAQVKLVEAEKDLEIAKKNRLVEREKAEAIAEQNRIAAKSITPEVLAYKKLETAVIIYTELAKSGNVVIVPADSSGFDSVTNDAVLAKLMGREIR